MSLAVLRPHAAVKPVPAAPPVTVGELNELLGLIYRGPLEATPWRSVTEALRQRFGASYVFLILRPPSPQERGMQIVASTEVTPEEKPADYFDSGYAVDPFLNLPPGRVVTVDEMIGAQAWVGGAFYRQFMPPGDKLRYILGVDIHTEEGVECRLRVCRPASTRDFDEAEKSLCQMLLPHLACSVRYHARLDQVELERSLLANTVEGLLVGTLIFDDHGSLMKMNAAAAAILAEKDGLELVRGSLQAVFFPEENRELQRLILETTSKLRDVRPSVLTAVSITRPSGRRKLGVMVRPIPIREWSESQRRRPTVAVFIRDPDCHTRASCELLNRLFRLTPAESTLAMYMANGLTLDEAAGELQIRKNTARAHLRSIFSKVGVTSQTALVRVLLNTLICLE
jgi:DNA-binding CsgD family transcriptional regulator